MRHHPWLRRVVGTAGQHLRPIFSLLALLGIQAAAGAAERTVGTVVADSTIAHDANTDNASVFPGIVSEENEPLGALANMVIRGGSGPASLKAKGLIRFELSEPLDPELPYFLEFTTDTDGTSGNTFTVWTITDPTLREFDEAALTWNNAPAGATTSEVNFTDVGSSLFTFSAPGTPNTTLLFSLGASVANFDTFESGGSLFATLGLTGNGTQAMDIASKENPTNPPARIFSFDVIDSVTTGDAEVGTTWSNSQPVQTGNLYRVLDSHTVTINNTTFSGEGVIVTAGGTLDLAASEVPIPLLRVIDGASLTESVSGDFALGDINAPSLGILDLRGDVEFSIDAGSAFFLDMAVTGEADLDFDSGTGSELYLTSLRGYAGIVRFNGTGDQVIFDEAGMGNPATLEMNSTGANVVHVDTNTSGGNGRGGAIVFNQPGVYDHAAVSDRLQGPSLLRANAPVTVDLTKTFEGSERRFLIDTLEGDADITVNGTATDPTSGSITLNEFELGASNEPATLATDPYAGTITTGDFVNVEIRRNLPGAKFVINQNGLFDMGSISDVPQHVLRLGEVEINSGASMIVGFEEDGNHYIYHVRLTKEAGRSGSLTLADGSRTVMQVNGTADNQFDTIFAEGDVALDGMLEIQVNPPPSGEEEGTPVYSPTLGDTFDIIQAVGVSLAGDYDDNGTVEGEDYDLWKAAFGSEEDLAADGNGDGVIDAADYTVWRDTLGQVAGEPGEITGTFSDLVVIDPNNVMAAAGLAFQLNYSPTVVQLEVVAAGSGVAAVVPEPSSLVLFGLLLSLLATHGRKPHRTSSPWWGRLGRGETSR